MNKYEERSTCACCDLPLSEMHTVLDLGDVPLAGFFPAENEKEKESSFPLKLMYCDRCKLVQTDSVIDPDTLFKDYRYLSSVGLAGHFKNFAVWLNEHFDLAYRWDDDEEPIRKNVLEFGCNDGVLLEPLHKIGANVCGVDPAENIVKVAREKGLMVMNKYFNSETFVVPEFRDHFDLVVANNTFAHITDIKDVVDTIKHVLKPNGCFVFEVHYVRNLLKENQWDNIYHEHIYYYSLSALDNLFRCKEMTVVDFEEIPIHAGSIRVTVENSRVSQSDKVEDRIKSEEGDVAKLNFFNSYKDDVADHMKEIKDELARLSHGNKIVGYGASGRANMFCNILDLTDKEIDYIVDESPERCGRYIANKKIPIVSKNVLDEDVDVDIILIFAWNYSKMIIEKTKNKNCKYFVAFPKPQLVESYEELEGFESI
jgi:methylation protein EvaC